MFANFEILTMDLISYLWCFDFTAPRAQSPCSSWNIQKSIQTWKNKSKRMVHNYCLLNFKYWQLIWFLTFDVWCFGLFRCLLLRRRRLFLFFSNLGGTPKTVKTCCKFFAIVVRFLLRLPSSRTGVCSFARKKRHAEKQKMLNEKREIVIIYV